ncbi:MAG: hypothetical protein AAF840_08700 [Bacteroidota bacterium]
MADKTKEQLQQELDALKAENKELKETAEMASGPVRIPGSAKVTLETPDGEKVTKKVGFKPGRKSVRLPNGATVSSAAFLKVVNGTKLTDEEAKDEQLKNLTKEAALAHLTLIVRVGGNNIEERK